MGRIKTEGQGFNAKAQRGDAAAEGIRDGCRTAFCVRTGNLVKNDRFAVFGPQRGREAKPQLRGFNRGLHG